MAVISGSLKKTSRKQTGSFPAIWPQFAGSLHRSISMISVYFGLSKSANVGHGFRLNIRLT